MKLIRYQVWNFRSVRESGWITTDDVTALIGVNESGKTNLLLPLWKLNPAGGEGDIEPNSDYPVSMFADIDSNPEKHCFIAAEFETGELAREIAKMTGCDASQLTKVVVRRYFDEEYDLEFPDFSIPDSVESKVISEAVSSARDDIHASKELKQETDIKTSMLAALESEIARLNTKSEIGADELSEISARMTQLLPKEPAQTSTIVPRLQQLLVRIGDEKKNLLRQGPQEVDEVHEMVIDRLPKFVYYSSYGNLDSDIYLPHAVHNLERSDLTPREADRARTLRVLFEFVGLQPNDILLLGKEANPDDESQLEAVSKRKEKRTLLMHSAGTKLTKEFKAWWKQGNYRFRFHADGSFFQIWVSDDQRPEEVKLESRSTGLQWFLSFFLVFLVESKGEHENAILLLDEPGHSLHPLSQRDLSDFFASLSKENQLMYTTHSPFLIDADRLERARKVYVADDGTTKATDNLRHEEGKVQQSGAVYAVHSALNLSVAESLLLGCLPVIVEGPSDQIYMTAIKSLLIGAGDIQPKKELVFVPGGGTKTSRVIASILTGRDESLPLILLDGDASGASMIEQLKNGLYREDANRVLCVDDFSGFEKSEIEDLFPPQLIAEVLDRWFRAEEDFAPVLRSGEPIVPQFEKWAESKSITLEKGWKVDLAKRVKEKAIKDGIEKISQESREMWKKLFARFEH